MLFLTLNFQCIYPQLQLYYQDLREDTTKMQIVALQVIAGYLSVVMPARSRSFTDLFNHCTCLLTGAESHQHFRQQGEKAVRGILTVLCRLLDYVSSRCYVSHSEEELQIFYQDLHQRYFMFSQTLKDKGRRHKLRMCTFLYQLDFPSWFWEEVSLINSLFLACCC